MGDEGKKYGRLVTLSKNKYDCTMMNRAASSLARRVASNQELLLIRQQQERQWRQGRPLASQIHTYALRPTQLTGERDDERNKRRMQALPSVASYHTTTRNDKAMAIILGLGALSATSYAAASAVSAYKEWKASLPEDPTPEEKAQAAAEEDAAKQDEDATKQNGQQQQPNGAKRENMFSEWFGVGVGAKYYEGGFEDTMTRREAALILGVRESSPPSRIKDAHRKLLILNHPDAGGSTYIAGKINEAKELLLKGRRDRN